MKLITELHDAVQVKEENVLDEEGKVKGKNLFIEGVFLQAECVNRNKRLYNRGIMEKEVGRYVTEKVKTRTAYGELGHPQGPTINLDRASHIIESLKFDGNNVIGRAKIFETPMGNIVKGLLDGGANLGVSSRGLGSLKENNQGIMEVQDDFKLVTAADIVADPSAPNAFVNGIMENVEYFFDESSGEFIQQSASDLQKTLSKKSKREINEAKVRIFENFLNLIESNNTYK